MFEALLSTDSSISVLVQHLSHQVFSGLRNCVPIGGIESKGLFKDVAEDFLIVIAFERRVAAEEDKEDNAETPHVAALVVIALEHLRGDIVRSAYNGVHALDLLLL